MTEKETQAQREQRQTAERQQTLRRQREQELSKAAQTVDKTVSSETAMPNPRHEVEVPEGVENPNLSLRWPELPLDAPLYDDEVVPGEGEASRERADAQADTDADVAEAADQQAKREATAREKRGR